MPAALTYPGVYIEEIPSGVRTITGVGTSITAFLGRALRGPINTPTAINSYGDFERHFGGLAVDYPMSYAVRDFYQNGGSQALIVRMYSAPEGGAGIARLEVGELKLDAANPGSWGNSLTAVVDRNDINDKVAERFGLEESDLFNLTIKEVVNKQPVRSETFRNLSVKQDDPSISPVGRARRIDRVLEQGSQLVRLAKANDGKPDLPSNPPENTAPDADVALSAQGGGEAPSLDGTDIPGSFNDKTGLYAFEKADLFNLLCIPPDIRGGDTAPDFYSKAMQYCVSRRALLIVDSPTAWSANKETAAADAKKGLPDLNLTGQDARNAAIFFPRVIQRDRQLEGQLDTFVPCGIIAGVMARTDSTRGVWKAPAGLDAALNGVEGLEVNLNDAENGMLNPLGINCLRFFVVGGRVVWGTRTLRGADQLADEYKYIPVRRTALFIEESLYRGLQWVVFEPNDEPLWAQIRLNAGAFMNNLFRQGAFQGKTPQEAYFVKCDNESTTQNDINLGIVNIIVGFAPLKPAEFVVVKIQQMAGQIQT